MVDISHKETVLRTAVASGKINLQQSTIKQLEGMLLKKGDVLACARVAGIMAAKKTPELIPLCHSLLLNKVDIAFTVAEEYIEVTATAICTGSTGVEMEALTAVSVAALTIYDMCKAVDRQMSIQNIHLVSKTKEALP